MTATVDPITLQVVGGALHSIAEQMGNVLYRMSYSSIIRESQDLGAGLFDKRLSTIRGAQLLDEAHGHAGFDEPGKFLGVPIRKPDTAMR